MESYVSALLTQRWDLIHEGAKKEAARQVRMMNKWLKLAEDLELEELNDHSWIKDAIKKAAKYQYKIYNRNNNVKDLERKISHQSKIMVDNDTDPERVKEASATFYALLDDKAEIESEQYALTGRIMKIFCAVHGTVALSVSKEDVDDMYDGREDLRPTD
jgi:hypothetical protein